MESPPKGDIKMLQGYSDGRKRLRIGKYRIIYNCKQDGTEQNFALELIKRLVLAWDPDFTKVTPAERHALEKAEEDIVENGTISHDAVNWD